VWKETEWALKGIEVIKENEINEKQFTGYQPERKSGTLKPHKRCD